ncbi:DoxX family protein [Marinoscillum furvescens]|uniref:DoxX-like protein n=1 Tax=Marinoscillum furvescens DSM 4134 TaxID=1122208 RepID=A0A3D9KY43_MARFU|nr:DoxX family membrane protein [Marinoscillum furvescens]RED93882.1 DoxX-like protein [Marinoscillum furvescens DSM 4134]
MKSLGFIGKLLYGLPFVMFGMFHFMNAEGMAGMVPAVFPFPEAWVYLTGLGHILAAVALIINKKAKLAMTLLGVMLLLFALLIHFNGFLNGDQSATTMFLKDIALSGAAFFMSSKLTN